MSGLAANPIEDPMNNKMNWYVSRLLEARNLISTGFLLLLCVSAAPAQNKPDVLKSGFENPPAGARPRVWWHWMNGNITQAGIKLDLEWMHRVGLGGFQNFDAALSTPQVVDKRLIYMTPEWKAAFKYATVLADRLGLEEAIAGSPGWSESGGPWVPPAEGMKKYVWSETFVEGGKPFTGKLEHPPTITGAFQNLGVKDVLPQPDGSKPTPHFYADVAVVAYRRAEGDVPLESLHPKVTASTGTPSLKQLGGGNLQNTTSLPIPPTVGGSAWIQYEFAEPQTMRSIALAMKGMDEWSGTKAGIGLPEKSLQASDDGRNFRTVVEIPDGRSAEKTLAFSPVKARFFRVVFKRGPAPPWPDWMMDMNPSDLGVHFGPAPTVYEIATLVLHPGARVNRFEEKAAFVAVPDIYGFATQPDSSGGAVDKALVVDLTSRLRPDGTLDWAPPAGDWVVVRFGYSLLGITNHPATPEATGLEVDKLNGPYVKKYMNTYLDSYKKTLGPDLMGKRGLRYVINDSWEAGSQNWTDDMMAQFKKRRGYDPMPWMPVLTGQIVESAESSDRFLWDFRKTIGDLIADEHYGQLKATLHAWGMGHYGESHEDGRAFVADGMEVKKFNEVPMGAMWMQKFGVNKEAYVNNTDDRESASVAHIYGQNLAAAESMTAASAAWAWSPATLKPTADQELLNGINRFVIHESAHQPLVGKAPGLTLGPFGQWFNRNETWAEDAAPWVNYIARGSYLLQQGHYAADLVYFYGEDSNLTAIFEKKAPDVPAGYGFDYINADGLIHMLNVVGGRITTESGMSYRVLGLDPYSRHMSLPVLRAIHKLVKDGAVVAGPKPADDPSLADSQVEFGELSFELFGDGSGVHHVGKGTVYAGESLAKVFDALKLDPDFDYTKPKSDTRILFAHRNLTDGDLYFVDNRNDRDEMVDATFRVEGKLPELWHPETGKSEPTSFRIAAGRTTVPLHLEPWGTVFVVFRTPTKAMSRSLPAMVETELTTLQSPWSLSFQPGRGAPASIILDKLISWPDSADEGIKYFSGAGTYTQTVHASADWFKQGAKLWIDLGDVKNLAEVTVNGKPLGVVWHAPFRVDVTSALKPGTNEVKIKVVNAWVNRLIGDEQPDATTKYTFADVKPYKASSPLLTSGLLGPVRIYSAATR
jgi:hypothetical protein